MRRRSRARAIASAVGALFVIAACEVGIPLALIRWVGWPLPHSWPSWQQTWEHLQTNGLPIDVVLGVVAVVVWIGWAYLTTALVAEIVAEVRGLPVAARRSLGPLQPVVGALVATVAIALTAGWTRSGGAAARPVAPLAASLAAARSTGDLTSPVSAVVANAPAVPEHAGDPVPARASAYVVRSGDSLWRIAGQRLHDALRWPEIWQRNRDRREPRGRVFTDPNIILPGWQLDLPTTDRADTPRPPSTAPATDSGGATSGGPAEPLGPHHPVPATAIPTPIPNGPPGGSVPACTPAANTAEPTYTPSPPPPVAHQRPQPQAPGLLALPGGGAVTLSLAGAVLAALAAAHLHQRRRRPLGGPPDGVADRIAALPTVVALRRQVRTAEPEVDDVPTVSTGGDDGSAVTTGNALGTRSASIRIPGAVGARGEIPLDLLDLAGVAFDGPGAEGAARALVVGLLAQHDAAHAEILAIGSVATLVPGLVDAPGVTAAPLERALTILEEQVIRRSRILAQRKAPNYRDLIGGDDLPQGLLVIATADEAGAYVPALTAIGERLGISVVSLGEVDGLRRVHVDADGAVDPALGAARHVSVLPSEPAGELLATVLAGRGAVPTLVATPSPAPAQLTILDDPLEMSTAPSDARRVHLRVFGGLRILVDGREVRTGLRRTSRALLALLAVRPEGVTMEEALDLLWHEEGRPDAGRTDFHAAVNSARGRIRDLLGTQEPMVIAYIADHYRIDADIVDVDLWQFRSSLQQAARAADDVTRRDALVQACAHVAGEPLVGVRGDWTESVREELRRQAVDALVQLAALHEAGGQIDAAVDALQSACAADPYDEALVRQLIRMQMDHGRRDAAERSYRVLAARLAELDAEPEDETEDLLAADHVIGIAVHRKRIGGGANSQAAILDEA